ncbi:hypothetical protein DQ384_36475 [Sphaerisporangium album]|uniref:Uncharacterized protein n=1 Tax=Sphaerisporangium album TaxID=509200 RepID=A0A367ESP3_9ACTN|nr:hypothetical protein [Sphaerisporangium album]RCG21114.1 hypothetical protein DQ384_36475 [Sphaerisporangium album]
MTIFGNAHQVLQIAESIAGALGEFRAVLLRETEDQYSAVMLVSGDRRLMLQYATKGDAYIRNRLTISGVSPTDGKHYWNSGPCIRVNAARPAETLAKDIVRRLMPEYLRWLDKEILWQAEKQARKVRLAQEGERIAALIPGGSSISPKATTTGLASGSLLATCPSTQTTRAPSSTRCRCACVPAPFSWMT